MDPVVMQAVIAGFVELLFLPIALFVFQKVIGKRLDRFDEKREEARAALEEAERMKIEQREAERGIVLAIARTMLLNNYEKCMAKGFYSVEERDVYGNLFRQYRSDGGNGVIEEIAPRIRALPLEPPNHGDLRRD